MHVASLPHWPNTPPPPVMATPCDDTCLYIIIGQNYWVEQGQNNAPFRFLNPDSLAGIWAERSVGYKCGYSQVTQNIASWTVIQPQCSVDC